MLNALTLEHDICILDVANYCHVPTYKVLDNANLTKSAYKVMVILAITLCTLYTKKNNKKLKIIKKYVIKQYNYIYL